MIDKFIDALFQWPTLLSNVGGQLGLWLGFSLITGVEILGLMLEVTRKVLGKICCHNSNRKGKTKVNVAPLY
jgi:hypothetical protein